jgi:D-sedoheptulose 7-phosphate isomerase
MKSFITSSISELKLLIGLVESDKKLIESIEASIQLAVTCLKQGGKIITCGNGGSYCDALHIAEELTGRFQNDRKALAAIPLSDLGHMTCVGNDYGFDYIFSRHLEALGKENDLFLPISTSGQSKNILEACQTAQQLGIKIVSFAGKGGGPLAGLSDISLIVPAKVTHRIQEVHTLFVHLFIEGIERELFPELYQ